MQLSDIDLRLLRVFTAIVECGGLSAAESKLNIGKSTISSHLADLENRLGSKLCYRGRGGFELTEPGKLTYEASLKLFQNCDAFLSTVATAKDDLSGKLKISMIDMTINDPNFRLSQTISRLKTQGHSIYIELNICPPNEVELAVLNGVSSIGIGVSRHPLRGLRYEHLYDEETYLYCGKDHPLFECNAHEIDMLLKQTEFITRGYMRGTDTAADELPSSKSAMAYHDEGIAHLILSGQFIGYLPKFFAQYWVDRKMMGSIDTRRYFYHTPIALITNSNRTLTKLEVAFINDFQN